MNSNQDTTNSLIKHLHKELRFTRFFCIISSLLTVFLIVGCIFVVYSIQPLFAFINDLQPVLTKLSQLDVDALNSTLQNLDAEELSLGLKNLNQALETLTELGQRFGGLWGSN